MCCNVPFPYKRPGLGWHLDGKDTPLLAALIELKEKVPHIFERFRKGATASRDLLLELDYATASGRRRTKFALKIRYTVNYRVQWLAKC